MENLQKRKKKIIEQIGDDRLKKLKFSKILKLLENEIQELMKYWTIKQVHETVNEIFELNISAPLFYRFCAKNLKKDEKLESRKIDKKINVGVSQRANEDTKKSENSVKNIDDLTESTLDFLSKNLPKK
ncbi:hypothetical protein PT502_03625 [Aliarcobacter butzleri]|uniref:hypothetical protein n=1 Tax=Aliarcobacter butzleri TaxID=28197 RepID=UPI0012606689|nr:hypothetical protein [Aliarcobacter butzleri]MCT7595604.1 hypothetical protein [Aliarcobacter butzleri]MDK2082884.1 hypothetical protein [Aliarcobacter butzleri]